MEWDVVCRKLASALAPGACLAIVERGLARHIPWASELAFLIPRFSTNQEFQTYDLIDELARRGLFQEFNRRTTALVAFSQPIDDYIESFHSRNGFSKLRMPEASCSAFDDALREFLTPYCQDGLVGLDYQCNRDMGHSPGARLMLRISRHDGALITRAHSNHFFHIFNWNFHVINVQFSNINTNLALSAHF